MHSIFKPAVLLATTLLAAPAALSQNGSLNVLVTNDDGYGTYGNMAMKKSLESLGHKVFVVSPATQQSGKSGSLNTAIGKPVDYLVKQPGSDWAVHGTPADSVNAGLNALLKDQQIDLVVSGANEGENVGRMTNGSGTVGAAMYALRRGIPAIAVSVGADIEQLGKLMELKKRFDAARAAGDKQSIGALGKQLQQQKQQLEASDHLAADRAGEVLVKVLETLGKQGMPKNLALNINIPAAARQPDHEPSLRLVVSDNTTFADLQIVVDEELSASASEPSLKLDIVVDRKLAAAMSGRASCEKLGLDLNSEGTAIACGLTTIAIFDGNYDALSSVGNSANQLACRLAAIADNELVECE